MLEEKQGPSFEEFLVKAIMENYFFGMIVTSATQGKLRSAQIPYGSGKTTFAMWTSCKVNSPEYIKLVYTPEILEWTPTREDWEIAFSNMVYDPVSVWKLLEPGRKRRRFVNWDDVAYTCPRTKGVPRFLVKLRGELTAARPEIAMLAMTASNRNDIAAPLRSFASFEAIIPQRGSFEIHQTYHYKNFKNPEQDWGTLHYIEEGRFPPLPEDVQTRYDEWRIVQKRYVRSPQYRTDLRELMSYADSEGGDAKTPQNPEDLFTNEWLEGTLKELGFRYDTAKRAKLAKRCKDRITGHEGDSVKNRPQSIPADSKAVGNPEDTKAQFEDSQGWSDLTPHSIVEEKTE